MGVPKSKYISHHVRDTYKEYIIVLIIVINIVGFFHCSFYLGTPLFLLSFVFWHKTLQSFSQAAKKKFLFVNCVCRERKKFRINVMLQGGSGLGVELRAELSQHLSHRCCYHHYNHCCHTDDKFPFPPLDLLLVASIIFNWPIFVGWGTSSFFVVVFCVISVNKKSSTSIGIPWRMRLLVGGTQGVCLIWNVLILFFFAFRVLPQNHCHFSNLCRCCWTK